MNFTRFFILTRFEQSLFGLPFLLSGLLLPFFYTSPVLHPSLLWVVPAFLGARISGMAFNQLIDREIDAKNFRTQGRLIPQGRVSRGEALLVGWVGLGLLLFSSWKINLLTLAFAPLAAALILTYSYTKRFTAGCHMVLGAIHFLAPVMGSAALTGELSLPPLFLGGVAFALVTGSDVVYATQDIAFDRKEGLCSLPAKWGAKASLRVAGAFHFAALALLVLLGWITPLGWLYFAGVGGVALILLFLYTARPNPNQFLLLANVCTSSVLFIFLLGEFIWRVT